MISEQNLGFDGRCPCHPIGVFFYIPWHSNGRSLVNQICCLCAKQGKLGCFAPDIYDGSKL